MVRSKAMGGTVDKCCVLFYTGVNVIRNVKTWPNVFKHFQNRNGEMGYIAGAVRRFDFSAFPLFWEQSQSPAHGVSTVFNAT